GDVVGVGRDGGEAVGERLDAEARRPVVAGALDHVADEMRGGGGAAAVAACEDGVIERAGLLQPLDGLFHARQWNRLDGLGKPRLVVTHKSSHCPVPFQPSSNASASAPHSTLSSPSAAGTTSIRARDQAVIWRPNSSRSGTNRASPALEMPPPITSFAGLRIMIAAFRPRARSTT